jgi:DNA-binding transcriptional LysR family regulator
VTFDVLRSFSVLAAELHFTRAAEQLHVSQPALSKHIQQLETAVGVRLFVRDRRTVHITREGEILLLRVNHVLRALEDLEGTAKRLQSGEMGRLRIGFTPSAPHHVLPAIMSRFRKEHSAIEIVLLEASSAEQIQQLTVGTLDIGILRPPAECPRSLTVRRLLQERYVAVLPRDHVLASRKRINLSDLANESFILIARRVVATVHDQILEACRAAGFTPRVVHEASHIHAIAGLVGAGCGVSILAASVQHVRLPLVVYRPLAGSGLTTAMALAFPTEHRSSAIDAFLAVAAGLTSTLKM